MDEIEILKRKIEREKSARLAAEDLLEKKTLELYNLNRSLENQVHVRTQELSLARDEALAANKAKGQFLANMSHEIRTPLHGMLGLLDLLKQSALNKTQVDYVETVMRSGRMLLTIINEILDFSRIEAGKFDFEHQNYNLVESIESVADVLAHEAYRKGLGFTFYVSEDVPSHVVGDESRVRQVLMNLLGNAIKFTPFGDVSLEVDMDQRGCTRDSCFIEFKVKDTGIGIPKSKMAKIFEPFSQVDLSDTRKYGGSGLGLTITKYIIERLGGELRIQSEEGLGSEFSFSLPFRRPNKNERVKLSELPSNTTVFILGNPKNRNSVTVISKKISTWKAQPIQVSTLSEVTSLAEGDVSVGKLILIYEPIDVATLRLQMQSENWRNISNLGIRKIILVSPILRAEMEAFLQTSSEMDQPILISHPVKQKALHQTLSQMLEPIRTGDTDPVRAENKTKANIGNVSQAKSGQASTKRLHVLLVEDNEINQMVATALLDSLMVSYDLAANGEVAVNLVKSQKQYDLILMDCQMPILDGYEATIAIRKWEGETKRAKVPIIALTANAFRSTKEKCLESGMDDFVTKPFQSSDLSELLKKYTAK